MKEKEFQPPDVQYEGKTYTLPPMIETDEGLKIVSELDASQKGYKRRRSSGKKRTTCAEYFQMNMKRADTLEKKIDAFHEEIEKLRNELRNTTHNITHIHYNSYSDTRYAGAGCFVDTILPPFPFQNSLPCSHAPTRIIEYKGENDE
jgi:hypothetical protein